MDLEYKINKAEKLFNENEYDKSNQLYKEVLRERPYNLQALINISDNLIRQNKSLEAEPYALDAYLLYKDVDDMTVANYSFVLLTQYVRMLYRFESSTPSITVFCIGPATEATKCLVQSANV